MKKIIADVLFLIIAAIVILPAPVLLLAHMTGQTFEQVLWR